MKPRRTAFLQKERSSIFGIHRNNYFPRLKSIRHVLGCHQMSIDMSSVHTDAHNEGCTAIPHSLSKWGHEADALYELIRYPHVNPFRSRNILRLDSRDSYINAGTSERNYSTYCQGIITFQNKDLARLSPLWVRLVYS